MDSTRRAYRPLISVAGLTKDEQELHGERIKLWNDFNICWLAVLQRQKDITQEMVNTGRPPLPPQNYLQAESLERMGRELVRLCDGMERHGLVDYQMGVWEEEIVSGRFFLVNRRIGRETDSDAVLIDCLEVLELLEGDDDDGAEEESNTQNLGPSLGSSNR